MTRSGTKKIFSSYSYVEVLSSKLNNMRIPPTTPKTAAMLYPKTEFQVDPLQDSEEHSNVLFQNELQADPFAVLRSKPNSKSITWYLAMFYSTPKF